VSPGPCSIWAVHLMKIQRSMFYSLPNRYKPIRIHHVTQSSPSPVKP
jgi:hypothetical protein